jgi:hypothetical protein
MHARVTGRATKSTYDGFGTNVVETWRQPARAGRVGHSTVALLGASDFRSFILAGWLYIARRIEEWQ